MALSVSGCFFPLLIQDIKLTDLPASILVDRLQIQFRVAFPLFFRFVRWSFWDIGSRLTI